jgi:hypothetical protein
MHMIILVCEIASIYVWKIDASHGVNGQYRKTAREESFYIYSNN